MTIINQKSISGITSITFASAGDDLLTFHSNDGTERFRIDNSGNTKITAGIVTTLNLSKQDHKVTATGICTITVTGGTEADSHTVRIINSGIATVGFSTYFLFPSGATPSLPTADGSFSQISFQVNRVGAAGTQLFTTAAVNFS